MSETTTNRPPGGRLGQLRAEVEAARESVAYQRALRAAVYEDSPDGVTLIGADGKVTINPKGESILARTNDPDDEEWKETFGFFHMDGSPYAVEELPGFRSLQGERIDGELIEVRLPADEAAGRPAETVIISCTGGPLEDGRAISVFRDVTEQLRLERELEERGQTLAARDAENRALIDRLRVAIDEISTPVLKIAEDILVMPIIGIVDGERSARASERLMHEVSQTGARCVIIDVTGVDVIDTTTADLFGKLTRAVELLGCRAMVSGMQPSVAQTLTELGIRLDQLPSHRNLRAALSVALAHPGRRRWRRRRSL